MEQAVDDHVEIQCFGVLQQVCGGPSRRVPVAAWPVSVADALAALARAVPGVADYLNETACAVGDRIVAHDTLLERGDALVLLPPVSGG